MEDRVGKYCLNQKVWIAEATRVKDVRISSCEIRDEKFLYKTTYQGGLFFFEKDIFSTKEEAINGLIKHYEREIENAREKIEEIKKTIKVVKDGL